MPNLLFLCLFSYLLLGHLLADFVFQPKALVDWKHRDWLGILVHSLVVFVMSMICLVPAFLLTGARIWIFEILIANAVLHFAMDGYKIRKEEKCEVCMGGQKGKHRCYLTWFVLDQLFHVLVLLGATFLLYQNAVAVGGKEWVAFFFLLLVFWPFAFFFIAAILATFVYEIVRFQFELQKNGGMMTMKFHWKAMLLRLSVIVAIFVVVMFFWGERWFMLR